jgi:3-oxoacyl-[acyl-carrier-protein] synthase-3
VECRRGIIREPKVTGAYIATIEYALPARSVTNQELERLHPQWQMDQVALRTGVQSRHLCEPGETALDLAEAACRKLSERPGVNLAQVDSILFCTQSPDHIMPPNACLLQERLGLPHTVAALDFTLACSGFIYGLYIAKALVVSGMAKNILLVTSETYSKWIHSEDRAPLTLFGDGAAATLVSGGASAIGEFALATDGGSAACFIVPAGGARQPRSPETARLQRDRSGNVRTLENLYMDGVSVLDFVKKEIPSLVRRLLQQEQLVLDDIDLVVFHQASQLTLDFLFAALHVPAKKQFNNIAHIGNTVSASIPIALRDAELQGRLKPGMRVLLVGFGVGLSWGACIVNWQ